MAIVQIKIATLETKIAIVQTKKIYTKKKNCFQLYLFSRSKNTDRDITKKKHIASGVMIPETYITETLSHHFVDSKKGYHI